MNQIERDELLASMSEDEREWFLRQMAALPKISLPIPPPGHPDWNTRPDLDPNDPLRYLQ